MEIQVGARIRELRAEKGLSQADLARQLDVSAVTVYRWESGTREISLTMLGQVADKLDIALSEFFPKAQSPLFSLPDEMPAMADRIDAAKKAAGPQRPPVAVITESLGKPVVVRWLIPEEERGEWREDLDAQYPDGYIEEDAPDEFEVKDATVKVLA